MNRRKPRPKARAPRTGKLTAAEIDANIGFLKTRGRLLRALLAEKKREAKL